MKDEIEKIDSLELEEKLVCKNYGLVVSQALSFSNQNSQFSLEDYIQVGLIGLLKAINLQNEHKFYDTNLDSHHHIYNTTSNTLRTES